MVPRHERNVAKHSSGKGEEAGGTRLVEQGRDETKTRSLPEVQRELGTGRVFGRIVEIRSGVNQFEDEQGRRKKIPKEQRLCKICGKETENEEHVLLKCTLYRDIREDG